MALKKSEFLSVLGIMFQIWKALVDEVLSLGGGDDDLRRIQTDSGLRRKLAEFIVKYVGVLKQVSTVTVSGSKKFVAKIAFGPNNPDGIKFYLGSNFENNFLGKIEENVEPTEIAVPRLEKSSRDPEIMAELGVEKKVIKLSHFYNLIKAQANGQEGTLLVNGCATIAYIEDKEGNLWAVDADWHSDDREWHLSADSVENPFEWNAGRQVLSCK